MSNQEQFNDPVVEREQSGLWWQLKRPFVAAFYKSNEEVSSTDVFAALLLHIAVSAAVVGGLGLVVAAAAGVETAAAEMAATEPFKPINLLSSVLTLGATTIALLPIVAMVKLAFGMGSDSL